MLRRSSGLFRFVRGLAGGGAAIRHGDRFQIAGAAPMLTASVDEVSELIRDGVLDGTSERCTANTVTRSWLKRQLLIVDAFAGQHRIEAPGPDGAVVNLAESPLLRLGSLAPGETRAFLERHQIEAGERVRKLVARAQLQPRLTMAYSGARTAGRRQQGTSDISDMAAEARRQLAEIHRVLPRDCAGVVFDVCGLSKGLQAIESERGWPRRSAKLVLRIGLDRLAEHYGLAPHAVGQASRGVRAHIGAGARPTQFG